MAAIRTVFFVEDVDSILADFDTMKVYRGTSSSGPWVEITDALTRIALVSGQSVYDFLDTGGSATSWYAWSYYNSVSTVEGSLSTPIQGQDEGGLYATVQDLRDEGVTVSMLSDDRALEKLRTWSQAIEEWTGRWFKPRERTFHIDGDGSTVQRIGHPIIKVDSVSLIEGRDTTGLTKAPYSLADLVIYNRHLTQGLRRPDDRMRPKIAITELEGTFSPLFTMGYFPRGRANIEVTGLFGYTEIQPGDPVGETFEGSQVPVSYGSTPRLIKLLCLLLVIRDQAQLADLESREDWSMRWRLLSEKTRDQSYTLQPLQTGTGGMAGAWTGDPQIDGLIATFKGGSRSMAEAV